MSNLKTELLITNYEVIVETLQSDNLSLVSTLQSAIKNNNTSFVNNLLRKIKVNNEVIYHTLEKLHSLS